MYMYFLCSPKTSARNLTLECNRQNSGSISRPTWNNEPVSGLAASVSHRSGPTRPTYRAVSVTNLTLPTADRNTNKADDAPVLASESRNSTVKEYCMQGSWILVPALTLASILTWLCHFPFVGLSFSYNLLSGWTEWWKTCLQL